MDSILTRASIQALILSIVLFLVPGMNSLIVGLGAGGSHPSNIEVVDRINVVGTVFMILGGIVGGSVNNQLGPRNTLMIGVSGYSVYTGSLWQVVPLGIPTSVLIFLIRYLDQGRSPYFAYFASIYKGSGAGLLYTTVGTLAKNQLKIYLLTDSGYISTSYAQEKNRGIYIGAIFSSIGLGSVVGSGYYPPSPSPEKFYLTITP